MAGQNQRSVTRDVPPLNLRASFEPATVDMDKRTVQLTWTTGAAVLRGGFFTDPYYEELSLDPKHVRMERLQSGAAPLLNSHNSYDVADVLGVVENATLGKKSGTATVRFAKGPEGDDALAKVADGILRNISVGYRTYEMQQVKGGDGTIARFMATDWEPYEISLVPIGADAGAVTRSAAGMTPCVFIQERAAMENENPSPTIAPAVAPTTTAPATASSEQLRAAERAAEARAVERVLGIQRRGASLGQTAEQIKKAIEAGETLEAFTARAVEERAVKETLPIKPNGELHIQGGEDRTEKVARGMAAWLIMRSGQQQLVAAGAEKAPHLVQKVDTDPGEFRGMTLVDMARASLEAANIRTAGMSRSDLVGKALTHRSPTASSSDFPNILENILYKVLLAQYAITPDTWKMFCKIGSVSDFRTNKRYRMGTFGSLDALNELGEFKTKSIPDAEKQSLTASTKGNIIGISRQTIINDDMGAFDTLAAMFGRAAALSQEVDVYALLALNAGLGPTMTDGNTLFHATHGNLTTGAALGSAAIDADRVAMGSQKDPSNNEILALIPAVLVLPIGLGGTARQINNGQYDFDVTSKFQIPNRVGGLFRNIIDTPRITGTRRYLFADPGVAPTIELAYVEGQGQPFMDQHQGWRVDGVEWKVRMDYGVAAIDFRGAITNAGV